MEFWGNFAGETIPHILFVILMVVLSVLPFVIMLGIMFLPQLIKDDRKRSIAIPVAAIILVALVVLLSYVWMPSGPQLP